jgi:hypothetical protein
VPERPRQRRCCRPRRSTTSRSGRSGPLFLAGLELWLAARSDEGLREALVPAEREIGRALRELFEDAFPVLAAAGGGPRRGRVRYESLLALLRGLALSGVLRADRGC